MTRFIDQFHEAMYQAKCDMLNATHWTMDREAFRDVLQNVTFGDYRSSLDPDEPFFLLGLRVNVEPGLPPGRVILAASQVEVSEFTLDQGRG